MNPLADVTLRALTKKYLTSFINGLFFFLLAIVSFTLLTLHEDEVICTSYLAFPFLMATSYLSANKTIKNITGLAALLLVVTVGLIFPVDVEEIEEAFILIPLLYIIIAPHSLWPIASAFLLLLTYIPSFAHHSLSDIFEDGLEIIVISTFATVMSFYQHKTRSQALYFKEQSLTDALTQIPNRKAFNKQLQRLLTEPHNQAGFGFAVLLLDLDDFKRINDQFGHDIGDHLLIEQARRISLALPPNASAYRIGGDEFCIIVTAQDQNSLKARTTELLGQLYEKKNSIYQLKHCFKELTPTVGIALYPQDGAQVDQLFRNADLAMYHCKKRGKNTYAYFKAEMLEKAMRRYEIEEQLKTAIEQDELYLMYQPKVCLSTGKIKGVEALVRWQSPSLGLVSPAEFIPVAEATGSIVPIGRWVLQQACAQLQRWQAAGHPLSVAVNVSAVQMMQNDFVDRVTETIKTHGIDASKLELELTETAMMSDPKGYIGKFNALKKLDIQLAIDDFGTAYSSLAYLSQLPVDTLKIDKSFVDHCTERHEDRMIVRTIVQLSQNLGLTTVAEGVEYDEQKELLLNEGADLFQGYLHSKPMPADEFDQWLT